ncbi:S-adenosyl-L-methionine-dependent methyltransferase [Morchella snyderi]|nr:S-adenosyl-L-methionine-dependent methyltransferase [Morchella snyderi]
MPRLPPHLLHQARAHSPLLPLLLPECRAPSPALSELRWLRAHAAETRQPLRALCERRGRGEPLQYILGTQPFGALEILCHRGVLIPRQETEHLIHRLAARLPSRPLRILDLCTGTGCISLLLHSLLHHHHHHPTPPTLLGIDLSPRAVSLARRNLAHNIALGALPAAAAAHVSFLVGDVLDGSALLAAVRAHFGGDGGVDVVVANPPYISVRGFAVETARSVRRYEPRLALVPGDGDGGGDGFYPVVGRVAGELGAGVVAVEVGGWGQAGRVQRGWEGGWRAVEVWQDYAGRGRGVVAVREGWGEGVLRGGGEGG